MSESRRLWMALLLLALLSPLGLYLPSLLRAGSAWGEWGADEVRQMIGYVPAGMARAADIWKAPLARYALPGAAGASSVWLAVGYLVSALVGIGLCGGGVYLLAAWLMGRPR